MYDLDEYQYRVTRGTIEEATGMTWRRIDEEPQTPSPLEIVAGTEKEWPISQQDVFEPDTFFLDKLVQSHTQTDLLKNQLESRERLKNQHLRQVDYSIAYCKYKIWELDRINLGTNQTTERTRNTFSQSILNLQHEKRAEENVAWKDQTAVLKDFLESWGGYRADLWTYSVLNPKNNQGV